MAEPEQPNEPPPDATSARIESVLGKLRSAGGPSNSASRPEDLTNGDASLSTYALPSSLSRLLSTFSTRTWFAKPLGLLDALTCAGAALGWKNMGRGWRRADKRVGTRERAAAIPGTPVRASPFSGRAELPSFHQERAVCETAYAEGNAGNPHLRPKTMT